MKSSVILYVGMRPEWDVNRKRLAGIVRSVTPCDGINLENRRHFDYAPPTQIFPVERLMRAALAALSGWSFAADLPTSATLPPRTNLSRHDGAFLLHVYTPDTSASMRVRTPLRRAAPHRARNRPPRRRGDLAPRQVVAPRMPPFRGRPGRRHRLREDQHRGLSRLCGHLQVKGLENATLRFFPPADFAGSHDGGSTVERVRSSWNVLAAPVAPEWDNTPDGPCAVWRNVSGPVYIGW